MIKEEYKKDDDEEKPEKVNNGHKKNFHHVNIVSCSCVEVVSGTEKVTEKKKISE